jgi:hypothetical protein
MKRLASCRDIGATMALIKISFVEGYHRRTHHGLKRGPEAVKPFVAMLGRSLTRSLAFGLPLEIGNFIGVPQASFIFYFSVKNFDIFVFGNT